MINPPEFDKSMTGVPAHIVAVEKSLAWYEGLWKPILETRFIINQDF